MPKFVRKLEQATWWDTVAGESQEDIIADALKNALTDDGDLSIYEIRSTDDLELVMAALGYRRNAIRDADYCLFDETVLEQAGVKIKITVGHTGCDVVDKELHRDIFALSAKALSRFVTVAAHQGEVDSFDKSQMTGILRKFLGSEQLDIAKAHTDLRKAIGV